MPWARKPPTACVSNARYASAGPSLADLDSEAVFNKHAVEEIASLADLRKAPLVEEEYHGPLLMSADAATDTLHSLLAVAITATRPALGTEARTNGAFASSYHARVLPDFMNVVDDPSLTTFSGKGLLGAYSVDDEGVPARAVKLVDAGRLENYLIGREPVRDFPQSNGHGRAGITGAARPMIGVLKITAENGRSDDELNRKLLDMAKDRGLPSVYYVQTLGGVGRPRLLYRVTPDGKRELVRGAVLADIDDRALRSSIEAAGKDLWIANYLWRPARYSPRPRAALWRCHRPPRQREKREAAVLSPAGVGFCLRSSLNRWSVIPSCVLRVSRAKRSRRTC